MPRLSTLQMMLLEELQSAPAKSITELASRVGKLRPSVSRSLKLLQQQALVTYEDSEWRATRPGQAEADRAKQKLRGMEAQLQRTFRALAPRIPMPVIPTETFRTLATFSSRMESILSTTSELTRTNAFALSQLHVSQSEAIRRAIEPLTQLQIQSAALIKATMVTRLLPDFASLMQTYNRHLANAIDDSLALRNLSLSRIPELPAERLRSFTPLSVHFPEITEAVEVLSRELSHIATLDRMSLPEHTLVPMLVPPTATAAYSRSMRLWIEEDSDISPPESYQLQDPHALIHLGLAKFDPGFVEKHQGAWNAFRQGGPDSLRHAAVSMRELIRMFFKQLAPDQDLEEKNSTRLKARVRHILQDSSSGAQFVTHMALGLDGLFDRLNAYTHGDETDKSALQGIMIAADGMLLFVLHNVHRSSG